MKKLLLLFTLLFVFSKADCQTNGYSLEFDSTLILSLDTVPIPSAPAVRTKQFTVPTGMVLKINSGYLRNYYCNFPNYCQKTTLTIGSSIISPTHLSAAGFQDDYLMSFNTSNAIWVNAGQTVVLKFESNTSIPSSWNAISHCWIGGVLFRKIPN